MYSIGKRKWNKLRKRLPGNYRLETHKILLDKGFYCDLHEISDAVRGRLKNLEKLQVILNAIIEVAALEEEKQQKVLNILN